MLAKSESLAPSCCSGRARRLFVPVLGLCAAMCGCGDAVSRELKAGSEAAELQAASDQSVARETAGSASSEAGDGSDPAEKKKPFVFTLPDATKPGKVTGLDIEVTVDSSDAKEGYIIELTCPVGADQSNKQSLGSAAYVQPLKAGATTTISLPAPPDTVWLKRKGRYELQIDWQIKAGNPKRAVPLVELQIDSASAVTE